MLKFEFVIVVAPKVGQIAKLKKQQQLLASHFSEYGPIDITVKQLDNAVNTETQNFFTQSSNFEYLKRRTLQT